MATRKRPAARKRKRPTTAPARSRIDTSGGSHHDLRSLVSLLGYVIGCRIQRDAEGSNAKDPDADRVLAKAHRDLQRLRRSRDQAPAREALLALADELARSYKAAPPTTNDPRWSDYGGRIEATLEMHEPAPSPAKVRTWTLTARQVAHNRGPVEAGRRAVASIFGVGESTLRLWTKRGVKAGDSFGRPATLFYGTSVASEDALADLIELFGVYAETVAPCVSALRTLGARWDDMLDVPSRGTFHP